MARLSDEELGDMEEQIANCESVRDAFWLLKKARALLTEVRERRVADVPIPMYLTCPKCNARHIDEGEFATKLHHTHSCQSCGLTWRPAVVTTVGVAFLPGFKNPPEAP